MTSEFLTGCRRKLGTAKTKVIRAFGGGRRRTVRVDGGTVVFYTAYGVSRAVRPFREDFVRPGIKQIHSNIKKEPNLTRRTMVRDAYFESVLQSDQYAFPRIFVSVNPFGESPLTALALFTTQQSCRVRVTVKGNTPRTDYTYELPSAKRHRVPIVWLYPNRENKVLLELLNEPGDVTGKLEIPVTTGELPANLCDVIKVNKVSEDPAIKRLLVSGGVNINTCAFDEEGEIRFCLKRRTKGYGIFPLSKGRFIYMEKDRANATYTNPQCAQYHEMDYLGRSFMSYLTDRGIHHTVEERDARRIMAGTNTLEEHCEDAVCEIDRQTGEIVWMLKIVDVLGDTYVDMVDWAHVNSAAYNEEDDSVIISLRNVHAILCVDYSTKELKWLLADPDFWKGTPVEDKLLKPVGDVKWCYQQHSAFILKEDLDGDPNTRNVVVFDNHWNKRRPAESFDGDEEYSYATFYSVNEKEMTVSLFKALAVPKTTIRSNVILCREKNRVYAMCGNFNVQDDGYAGGLLELDYETGEILSDFRVKPGYFRGYEFDPCFEELVKPAQIPADYEVGALVKPRKAEQDELSGLVFDPEKRIPDRENTELRMIMQEDCLFLRALDHTVRKVYYRGENGDYVQDLDRTRQTMAHIFSDALYYNSMQIDTLPPDYYEIYLDYNGEILYTGKHIQKDPPEV